MQLTNNEDKMRLSKGITTGHMSGWSTIKLSKINLTIFLLFFLLIPLVFADTTFFDQDDAFVMGNSTTGGVIGETNAEIKSTGGCLTDWTCSSWSSCMDGIQIRNCTKIKNYCYADLEMKPAESQSCSGEGINNSPTGNEKGIAKTIILGILMVVVISISHHGYKRYKKHKEHKKIRHIKRFIPLFFLILFIIASGTS